MSEKDGAAVSTKGDQDRTSDHDAVEDIFDSALESLFGQHQAASGNPGQLCSLSLSWTNAAGTVQDDEKLDFRIPPNGLNKLQAHYQWDAGAFAARLIHASTLSNAASSHDYDDHQQPMLTRKDADVAGLDVLELGAGTGLPGIVSARRGARNVLITDYPDPGLLECIRGNVLLSRSRMQGLDTQVRECRNVSVCGLDWADKSSSNAILEHHPRGFQRIIAADVLWLSTMHAPLLDTIDKLLVHDSSARVLVISGFHTGRRALVHFFRLAAKSYGLVASLDTDLFEYNVVDGHCRPWSSSRIPFPDGKSSTNVSIEEKTKEEDHFDNMDDHSERTRWLLFVSLRRATKK